MYCTDELMTRYSLIIFMANENVHYNFKCQHKTNNVGLSTTFTITISARNKCGENGPIATAFYTLGKCWCITVNGSEAYLLVSYHSVEALYFQLAI